MQKLHESLFVLHKCDLNIRTVWKAISDHQSQKSALGAKHHYTINLTHYIILETQSFIDEYEKYFTSIIVEKEFSERLLIAKKLCKPILKQIAKWKGLRDFRNNIIAHPRRKDSNLIVPLNSYYDIPRTWIEFQFLKDLVHYLHETICSVFKVEMNECLFYGEELSEDVCPKFTISQINQEVINLHKVLSNLPEVGLGETTILMYTYDNV